MKRADFMKAEFATLRMEIKEAKARTYKTLLLGLTVVPAAYQLAEKFRIGAVLLALPMMVFVLGLMYLADNHTIMRCGRYIRFMIEPHVEPGGGGWETWLEHADGYDKRSVDRLLTYSFYLLFSGYFVISLGLAATYAYENYGRWSTSALVGGYGLLGAWFALYLRSKIRVSTSTSLSPLGTAHTAPSMIESMQTAHSAPHAPSPPPSRPDTVRGDA